MTQSMALERPLALRDYQRECLDALVDYKVGRQGQRALVSMATGLGKTAIFSHLPAMSSKRVLVLAHREELLDQARNQILRACPGISVGIEQANRKALPTDKVVVASVQTFAMSPKRLEALDPADFSVIVADEAHHFLARTFLKVLEHFGLVPYTGDLKGDELTRKEIKAEVKARFQDHVPPPGAPFLVGFTATPFRTDKRGLEFVFDDIVYSMGLVEGIQAEWLCRVRGRRVFTSTDLSKVHTRYGDFVESELAEAVNNADRNQTVVKAYQEYGEGRQCIVYCVDVAHTKAVHEEFRKAGINAEYVLGETATSIRRELVDRFRAKAFPVLINCMVFTEGFDAPETSCIVMARPTKSPVIYQQVLGRGTRIAPGKEDLLVLDVVDAGKVGVQSANTLFGLPPNLDIAGNDIMLEGEEAQKYADAVTQGQWDEVLSLDQLKLASEEFNPLAAASLDSMAQRMSSMAWVKTPTGYSLSVPGQDDRPSLMLGIIVDMLGNAEVKVKPELRASTTLHSGVPLDIAFQAAEDWVGSNRADSYGFLQRSAKWRLSGDPVTEKQVKMLKRLKARVKGGYESLTKGQASMVIDHYMNRRAV